MKALSSSSLAATKDVAPVFEEVGRIDAGIDNISSALIQLEDRLMAVLSASATKVAGQNSTNVEMCPLEAKLSDLAETAFDQASRIHGIINRLRI